MEEDEQPSVNLIPCVKWVRQGVAKAIPDKVILNERELAEIIRKTKDNLNNLKREDNSSSDENETESTDTRNRMVTDDEFNLNNYDEEKGERDAVLGIGDIAMYDGEDTQIQINDDDDSEKEDDEIKPSDNLILVGHVEGDASILEIYVYNEEEGSLYVHHDFLLPSFPLCIEWLNYDPSDSKPGNLCAVGTMEPIIEVWDLDIVDCLESAYVLGQSKKKKKKQKKMKHKESLQNGHKDAVLALAWNENYHHVLASGSADQTVLLWDLTLGKPNKSIKIFKEKVQTIQWHPFESYSLLTGSCDKMTRVFDCREDTTKNCLSWEHESEIETVAWNSFQPFCYLTGTSEGMLTYTDCRNKKPVWSLKAHEKEITGLYVSSKCPGLVTTASNDGFVCTWDLYNNDTLKTYESSTEPMEIIRYEVSIGDIQCLGANPNNPFVIAVGGDKKSKNFKVIDLRDKNPVSERFSTRKLVEIKVEDTGGVQKEESS